MDMPQALEWPAELMSSRQHPRLRAAFERGDYVRLVSGWYVKASAWTEAKDYQRFAWTLAARSARSESFALCGEAALVAMGLPTYGPPKRISVAEQDRGRSGTSPDTFSARGPQAAVALRAWRPVVRRHAHPHGESVVAGAHRVLPLVDVVAEVIGAVRLERSLPVVDALAAWGGQLGLDPGLLLERVAALKSGAARARAKRAWEARSAGSGSVGESVSRAIMLEYGVESPVLQSQHIDERGLVGYADFLWRGARVIGEFDGRLKYDGSLGTRTADQVFGAEKARENRLTALGFRVVRWGWADLRQPERLVRMLRAAGVPVGRGEPP